MWGEIRTPKNPMPQEIKEKIIEILQKHDNEESLREYTADQILELFEAEKKKEEEKKQKWTKVYFKKGQIKSPKTLTLLIKEIMKLEEARKIAEKYLDLLEPFCRRIQIAGSIRREKPEVHDIELVCIPKDNPQDFGSFTNIVNSLEKVKGEPTGRYTQRKLPEGINLDLFMANEENWGLIFAIRTGSADFSHKILACGWVKAGYKSKDGMLTKNGQEIECREEEDLFKIIGIPFVEPRLRF